MSGVNRVTLVGRLGQDPVMRDSSTGDKVANFSLATSENWKDKSGKKQETTEWHKVVAFKKLAEIVGQYLKKGSQIYIEGKLKTKKWQDKQGVDHYTTEIIANELQFLGSANNKDRSDQQESDSEPYDKTKTKCHDDDHEEFNDNIPF